MLEAGILFGPGFEIIYEHTPKGRTGGSLPDGPELWDQIWEHRKTVLGFAHSHPGKGYPGPSYEDITTFAAVERALGRRLLWPITSEDKVAMCNWMGPKDLYYVTTYYGEMCPPAWLLRLRELSGFKSQQQEEK